MKELHLVDDEARLEVDRECFNGGLKLSYEYKCGETFRRLFEVEQTKAIVLVGTLFKFTFQFIET